MRFVEKERDELKELLAEMEQLNIRNDIAAKSGAVQATANILNFSHIDPI